MTSRAANCPNCGAPLVYRWSSSVQTVCPYCQSIVVRTDVDLKKVGQVADLPDDASPIQMTTEGRYGDKGFVVAGRILYQYDQGGWNGRGSIYIYGGSTYYAPPPPVYYAPPPTYYYPPPPPVYYAPPSFGLRVVIPPGGD